MFVLYEQHGQTDGITCVYDMNYGVDTLHEPYVSCLLVAFVSKTMTESHRDLISLHMTIPDWPRFFRAFPTLIPPYKTRNPTLPMPYSIPSPIPKSINTILEIDRFPCGGRFHIARIPPKKIPHAAPRVRSNRFALAAAVVAVIFLICVV